MHAPDHNEDEDEPDMQPVPGRPGWFYDVRFGPWHEGRSMMTALPIAEWRDLYRNKKDA